MSEPTRQEKIEAAVAVIMRAVSNQGLEELEPDHPFNQFVTNFGRLSSEDQIGGMAATVSGIVSDVTVEELKAEVDRFFEKTEFNTWIVGQLQEIAQRHGAADDEEVDSFVGRAVEAGDEQAIKLVEMGALDWEVA